MGLRGRHGDAPQAMMCAAARVPSSGASGGLPQSRLFFPLDIGLYPLPQCPDGFLRPDSRDPRSEHT